MCHWTRHRVLSFPGVIDSGKATRDADSVRRNVLQGRGISNMVLPLRTVDAAEILLAVCHDEKAQNVEVLTLVMS